MTLDKKENLKRTKYRLYALYLDLPHYEFTEQDLAIYDLLTDNLQNTLGK